jgi:FkbM family methyltransferase
VSEVPTAPGSPVTTALRGAVGVARSLRRYYRRDRRKPLDRMHARFAGRGDLVFDIGSHVGDRIASFRRLGAHVIAVEPQPALAAVLRALYGRDRGVRVVQEACGAEAGRADLHLNLANPTVSTLSPAFIAAADGAEGWCGQCWERRVRVTQTTLAGLIGRFGLPRFVKIDVEGWEAEVLRGLDRPVPSLSFEFTTIQPQVAATALAECERLGPYRYNAAMGETQRLVHPRWLDADELLYWLERLPFAANSGDIYAVSAASVGAGSD